MWAGVYDHHRSGDGLKATANSAGLAVGTLGPVPEGYGWYVERETCYSNTAATTATLEVYVQATDQAPSSGTKRGRQDFTEDSIVQNGANDLASPIYVGPGQFIVAVWTGLTSGDLAEMTFQIRVHDLVARGRGQRHHAAEARMGWAAPVEG